MNSPLPMPPLVKLRAMLHAGLQAPSAENQHFLRFELGTDDVRLVSTDTSTWNALPHRRVLALIAYGAVVENISLRAGRLGLVQHTRCFPDPKRPDVIVQMHWEPSPGQGDALADGIDQRHTNRRFYRREPAAPAALQRLADAAAGASGTCLRWLAAPADRSLALRTMRLAESERFCRKALHEELFSAIRFDAGWKRSTDQGLPPGALEIEPPSRAAFAALRHWPLMRGCAALGMHHVLGLRAADLPCRFAPHIGIVCCRADDAPRAAFEAGRALQRAWLAATLEGLAFQPMAAAVALAHQRPGNGWVSAAAQQRIRDGLVQLAGGRNDLPFMLFRLGRAVAPTVATQRPPLDRFIA